MQRFENRTILITGGASGIGLATAVRLAREGARTVLIARNEHRLAEARTKLPGQSHITEVCDLTDGQAVKKKLKSIVGQTGKLHGAVLCAGEHRVGPLFVSRGDDFRAVFDANVITATNTVKAFIKNAHPNGSAVVLSSSAVAIRGNAGVQAYTAAKGALLALARSLAMELAPNRIRVNAVIAGVVQTPMTQGFFETLAPEQVENIEREHPLGLGTPEDVASVNAFLVSEDAKWITGTGIVADGGLTCN